jgi:hypothetical protein
MSFSCPHFDPDRDYCRLLKTDCVPGRRGCVLSGYTFAVPVEQRLRDRAEENRRRSANVIPTWPALSNNREIIPSATETRNQE